MPDEFGNLTTEEMEWWEGITGGTGQEYLTPTEEFQQFRTGISPYWRQRAPMEDVGQRMRARYALARPYMGQIVSSGAEGGFRGPSFLDYLADPTGEMGITGRATNIENLRARAQEASNIATLTPAEFTSQYAPGGGDFNRAAWYRMQFGGEGGRQSMQDVATMLALQRPGPTTYSPEGAVNPRTWQGAYRGRMANAIRSAMQEMYQGRVAGGADPEDFLSWYLGQTKPATTTQALDPLDEVGQT